MFNMFSGSTREGSVIIGDLGTKPIEHMHKTLKDGTIRRFMMVVLVARTISNGSSEYKALVSVFVYVGFFGVRIVRAKFR